jgi:hypothetical protein
MNSFHSLPGEVDVVFCDPVSTEGMTPRDMDKLSAMVRQVMEEAMFSRTPRRDEKLNSEKVAQ